MQDDVTAVSKRMANSLDELQRDVTQLGNTFRQQQSNARAMNVGIGEARNLFKSAAGNAKIFQAAMKDAGVSALDTRLMLNRLNSELTATRRIALGLDGVWSRVFNPRTIWAASHALNVAGKAAGAIGAVGGAVSGAAGMAVSAGKAGVGSVIDAATGRQNALASLTYMLNTGGVSEDEARGKAKDAYGWAQKYAKETPLDTKDIVGAFTSFMTAHYDVGESKVLTKVMADQAAKYMDKPEMGQNVVNAFSRVQGRGVATAEDLEAFRVAGFNGKDIMDSLRSMKDIAPLFKGIKKDASEEDAIKAIKKVLGEGKIGTKTFGQAAIDSLEKDRPDVGTMASKLGGESLLGTISNLKSAWEDMLQSTDLQNWPGVKALQNLMTRVSTALDASTDSGRYLRDQVEAMVNSMASGLDKISGKDISEIFARGLETAKLLVDELGKAVGWVDQLVRSGDVVGAVGDVIVEAGKLLGQGIIAGMGAALPGMGGLTRRVMGVSESDMAAIDSDASNRRKNARAMSTYRDTGPDYTTMDTDEAIKRAEANLAALDIPKLASGGIVNGPTLAIVGEAGPEAVIPLAGLRSDIAPLNNIGGATINLTIHSSGGSASDQWEALRPQMTSEIKAFFARRAME